MNELPVFPEFTYEMTPNIRDQGLEDLPGLVSDQRSRQQIDEDA